ncbi:MAG: rRNA pseudouridine synthase [Selenomonadaceae bacterium]|nr:rRNA pseudouridine synthase [Selenomonadaceae bacterium]
MRLGADRLSEERLHKVLSRAGVASRRAAEKLIAEGHVSVDGKTVRELGTKVDAARADIRVDGRKIKLDVEKVYVILNKPRRVLSAVSDDRGRQTVIDLIDDVDERIFPIGRLDYNTEGLLLLTNDGELTNGLLHPSHEIDKTYRAVIKGRVDEERLDRLRVGIKLEDGMTAPALVKTLMIEGDESVVEITIHEGRNRQVRRMFTAIGYNIKRLRRVSFAGLKLGDLKIGAHRRLNKSEVEALRRLIGE